MAIRVYESETIPVDTNGYLVANVVTSTTVVGTPLNGNSNTDGGTIIFVPGGRMWTGSINLSASVNSVTGGDTAYPNITFGGTPIVLQMALTTPVVTTVQGASFGNAQLNNVSLLGPGSLTLHIDTASAVAGSAAGAYQ